VLFITGASGYLGGWFLRSVDLRQFGGAICLSRSEPRGGVPGVEWVRGDLLEPDTYSQALGRCDRILHLAAATGRETSETYFRQNREGTRMLAAAAKSTGNLRLLHVSAIAAKIPDRSRYPYAESKRQAEIIVEESGLPFTIVRPTMLLGANSPAVEELLRLAERRRIPLPGDGEASMQPIYVDDAVRILSWILLFDWFEGAIVEIGGPDVVTARELLTMVSRKRFGAEAEFLSIPTGFAIGALNLLEKPLLRYLPVTAGELTALASDGRAKHGGFPPGAPEPVFPLSRMLDEALAAGTTPS
jgi:nucleoside-diphosphate-sugar epimerase